MLKRMYRIVHKGITYVVQVFENSVVWQTIHKDGTEVIRYLRRSDAANKLRTLHKLGARALKIAGFNGGFYVRSAA